MEEIWTLYEEAMTNPDQRDGFTRTVRAFGSFDAAKKAFATRLAYYASEKENPFGNQWSISKVVSDALLSEDFEDTFSDEDQAASFEYFSRFFGGDAGNVEVSIDGENYTCFEQSYWGELWSDFTSGITQCPLLHMRDWDTVETNAFLITNPEETYFFRARSTMKYDADIPCYVCLQLTKANVE